MRAGCRRGRGHSGLSGRDESCCGSVFYPSPHFSACCQTPAFLFIFIMQSCLATSLFHGLLLNCALGGPSLFITRAAYQKIFAKENIFSLERNNVSPLGAEAAAVSSSFKIAYFFSLSLMIALSSLFKVGDRGEDG